VNHKEYLDRILTELRGAVEDVVSTANTESEIPVEFVIALRWVEKDAFDNANDGDMLSPSISVVAFPGTDDSVAVGLLTDGIARISYGTPGGEEPGPTLELLPGGKKETVH
jgi:hypothetical protein